MSLDPHFVRFHALFGDKAEFAGPMHYIERETTILDRDGATRALIYASSRWVYKRDEVARSVTEASAMRFVRLALRHARSGRASSVLPRHESRHRRYRQDIACARRNTSLHATTSIGTPYPGSSMSNQQATEIAGNDCTIRVLRVLDGVWVYSRRGVDLRITQRAALRLLMFADKLKLSKSTDIYSLSREHAAMLRAHRAREAALRTLRQTAAS